MNPNLNIDFDRVSKQVKSGLGIAEHRLEDYTESLAKFARKNPWMVVLAVTGLVAAYAAYVYRIELSRKVEPLFRQPKESYNDLVM
ncbi:MAG: hypothetical protein A2622_12525 [Bdellovibrionales bacterium RIFCSPHIGHO2_01_FULL_40_29]|nr:MAG: hypothetical protein A2622_12525 [Bdellovibrionales bacterium RIFCSPHIGHO2_01_FULL_40_29]